MVIINGKILSMSGKEIEKGYVSIVDNKIEKVGRMEELKVSHSEQLLDVNGAWVMPGIIEAHCHIGITEEKFGTPGDDCNELTEPITPWLRAIDAVNPMDAEFHDAIKAGITGVMVGPGSSNVVGGQFAFLKTQGRCIDEMIIKAPAAMKVAFGENPKNNYGDMGKIPSTRMAVAGMLREELSKAKKYLKDKEEAKENNNEFALDFRLEAWTPVIKKEVPIKAHVHRSDDILTAIRIAKEFDVKMTLDHCTEGHLIADHIFRSGFPAIVGPGFTARSKSEIQNLNFKTSGILSDKGVMIAIMTDHPVSPLQYLPLCAGLAVKEGLPLGEGLKAITINSAKICGVDDRVGSLQKGKDADIAIFTGNPMDVFTETLYTIINGEIVYTHKDKENEE